MWIPTLILAFVAAYSVPLVCVEVFYSRVLGHPGPFRCSAYARRNLGKMPPSYWAYHDARVAGRSRKEAAAVARRQL